MLFCFVCLSLNNYKATNTEMEGYMLSLDPKYDAFFSAFK